MATRAGPRPAAPARRDSLRLLTLSSDLGAEYAAQVKSVLYRELAPSQIVELTHDLPAHGIVEGAFLLFHMARRFPPGTVHLAIVDPGVGGRRRPVAIRCSDGSWIVGPDNGLLWPLAEFLGAPAGLLLDRALLGLPDPPGPTFDGRDLFAPAAAQLVRDPRRMDPARPVELQRLELPSGVRTPRGALGSLLHIDRFGNLITDIPTRWSPRSGSGVRVQLGREHRFRAARASHYEELDPGAPGLIGSSFGLLEIALREARASERWPVRVGERVELSWIPTRLPARPRYRK